MDSDFERVYTVIDFWDGPRGGVADFRGVPHVYRSVFRTDIDEWDDDRFYLSPLTPQEAALAREHWSIWQRFAEHYRGKVAPVPTDRRDWGALPEDLARHRELCRRLPLVYIIHPDECIVARAEFRRAAGPPHYGPWDLPTTRPYRPRLVPIIPRAPSLEVRWSDSAREVQRNTANRPTVGALSRLALFSAVAGAISGAATLSTGLFAIELQNGRVVWPFTTFAFTFGALIGGALGALLLTPTVAFTSWRDMPNGRLFGQLTVGAVIGGCVTALLIPDPVFAFFGAVLGSLIAGIRLESRNRLSTQDRVASGAHTPAD